MLMNDVPTKKKLEQRDFVNVITIIFLILVLAVTYFVTDMLSKQNALEKCFESGRRNCSVQGQ